MKTFLEKSRENYNRIADNYDNTYDGRFTKEFKELLLEERSLKPGDAVLDVACGNGTLLKMISERWEIKGSGIDISEKMIENAKRKCPDMTFEVGPCERSSFPGSTFDVITVCAAYHHFPDVKAFAQEANRLLKPNGLLFIADVYYSFLRGLVNLILPFSHAGDVRCYSPKEIRTNFESHGFKLIGFKKRGVIQLVEMQRVDADL